MTRSFQLSLLYMRWIYFSNVNFNTAHCFEGFEEEHENSEQDHRITTSSSTQFVMTTQDITIEMGYMESKMRFDEKTFFEQYTSNFVRDNMRDTRILEVFMTVIDQQFSPISPDVLYLNIIFFTEYYSIGSALNVQNELMVFFDEHGHILSTNLAASHQLCFKDMEFMSFIPSPTNELNNMEVVREASVDENEASDIYVGVISGFLSFVCALFLIYVLWKCFSRKRKSSKRNPTELATRTSDSQEPKNTECEIIFDMIAKPPIPLKQKQKKKKRKNPMETYRNAKQIHKAKKLVNLLKKTDKAVTVTGKLSSIPERAENDSCVSWQSESKSSSLLSSSARSLLEECSMLDDDSDDEKLDRQDFSWALSESFTPVIPPESSGSMDIYSYPYDTGVEQTESDDEQSSDTKDSTKSEIDQEEKKETTKPRLVFENSADLKVSERGAFCTPKQKIPAKSFDYNNEVNARVSRDSTEQQSDESNSSVINIPKVSRIIDPEYVFGRIEPNENYVEQTSSEDSPFRPISPPHSPDSITPEYNKPIPRSFNLPIIPCFENVDHDLQGGLSNGNKDFKSSTVIQPLSPDLSTLSDSPSIHLNRDIIEKPQKSRPPDVVSIECGSTACITSDDVCTNDDSCDSWFERNNTHNNSRNNSSDKKFKKKNTVFVPR